MARRARGVFLGLWAARPRGCFQPLGEGVGGEARGFTDGQEKSPRHAGWRRRCGPMRANHHYRGCQSLLNPHKSPFLYFSICEWGCGFLGCKWLKVSMLKGVGVGLGVWIFGLVGGIYNANFGLDL